MADRPVDLGWVRILCEVGRASNFTVAANRLGLSQPAVSYQIRRLEEQLQVDLLTRQHRGVELTTEGRRLFELALRFTGEVDQLAQAIRRRPVRRAIRLTTDYAFSTLWLMPRMHGFRTLQPEMDIQIVASHRTEATMPEEGEIAVVFGTEAEFSRTGTLLLPERVVPVCAPAFLAANGPLETPGDLARARLLHLDTQGFSPWHDWASYLQVLGTRYSVVAGQGEVRFNTYSLVVQAAMAEQGIALGWLGLVDSLLDSGMLVTCGTPILTPERGYWIVAPDITTPETEALRLWLMAQFRRSAPDDPDLTWPSDR